MLKELSVRHFPNGCLPIFLIQIFATLGYAALNSSLVLFLNGPLQFNEMEANTLVGCFIAFNYSLHLLAGYLGGKLVSFRGLFTLGMSCQLIGCFILAQESTQLIYWGLACFLSGAGLNVTSLNMMLSQRFIGQDELREKAFLLNYSGMNFGFFTGFSMAGYFHLIHDYQNLFLLAAIGNILALIITLVSWKSLKDIDTPLTRQPSLVVIKRLLYCVGIIAIMIPTLQQLLMRATLSNTLVVGVGLLMAGLIVKWAVTQPSREQRDKLMAYLVLSFASLVFWSLYQIAPMGLTVFAEYNVDRQLLGITISPQWIQNINSIVIVLGGPLMITLMRVIRTNGWPITLSVQFATALVLIGLGFLTLPLGIHFADAQGLVAFHWIALSYVLQSLGELFLSPIGYAMVGRLVPTHLQGMLMGTWMMISGVAGVAASYFSNIAIHKVNSTVATVTNPGYASTFAALGSSAILVGLLLCTGIRLLNRMTGEAPTKETLAENQPVALA